MTVQITIIGMGKIGASAGLALAKHTDQLYRVGLDKHPEYTRRAQKIGAIDKVAYNLPRSVKDAGIVLLALPANQIKATIPHIAPDLKDGTVVLDTSPAKESVAKWMKDALPDGCHYVGLAPIVNAKYLLGDALETEAGQADLFQDGVVGIAAPQGTPAQAIKLAVDLTNLLGAKPMFMDLLEVDSLLAAMHIVPQLVAAGFFGGVSSQPGWSETRKVSGIPFAQTSAAFSAGDPPESLSDTAILNSEHVLRGLDNVIHYLKSIRGSIAEGDSATLSETLTELRATHKDWWQTRQLGTWDEGVEMDMPTSGDAMRQWVIGKRGDKNER